MRLWEEQLSWTFYRNKRLWHNFTCNCEVLCWKFLDPAEKHYLKEALLQCNTRFRTPQTVLYSTLFFVLYSMCKVFVNALIFYFSLDLLYLLHGIMDPAGMLTVYCSVADPGADTHHLCGSGSPMALNTAMSNLKFVSRFRYINCFWFAF